MQMLELPCKRPIFSFTSSCCSAFGEFFCQGIVAQRIAHLQIDPNMSQKTLGKIEDDVPAFFKRMRYPFQISKSSLFAVGSPHTWPTLLASLVWVVELLLYSEKAVRAPACKDHDFINSHYVGVLPNISLLHEMTPVSRQRPKPAWKMRGRRRRAISLSTWLSHIAAFWLVMMPNASKWTAPRRLNLRKRQQKLRPTTLPSKRCRFFSSLSSVWT